MTPSETKITLVRCPFINPLLPDIGLDSLAAFLRRQGRAVSAIDFNIEYTHHLGKDWKKDSHPPTPAQLNDKAREILANSGQDYAEIVSRILQSEPTVVGFSVWDCNTMVSLSVAEELKKIRKDIIIVFGGPECLPLRSGKTFANRDFIDFVVYGEGELTLNNLVESISRGASTFDIPGLLTKRDGKILDSGPGEIIQDLNELPFPDYTDYPLALYPDYKSLYVTFSRGCHCHCVYCSVPGTFKLRSRTAETVFADINFQLLTHPETNRFHFCDANLNSCWEELLKLSEMLISSDLQITWAGFFSVSPLLGGAYFDALARSGCRTIVVGIESASPKVMKKMGKTYSVEDAKRMIIAAHNAGIEIITNFIIASPWEEEEDFNMTLKFIEEMRPYINQIGSKSMFWIETYAPIFKEYADAKGPKYIKTGNNVMTFQSGQPECARIKRFDDFVGSLGYDI